MGNNHSDAPASHGRGGISFSGRQNLSLENPDLLQGGAHSMRDYGSLKRYQVYS
jgi:hypothetical protein